MNVKDWAFEWLDVWCDGLKAKTLEQYRWLLTSFLLPEVGEMDLDAVEPRHLQGIITRLRREGKERTAQLVLIVARALWSEAVARQIAAKSPAATLRKPRHQAAKAATMTEAEVKEFRRAGRFDPYWIAFSLMLEVGMRRGEVIGLRWEDIDVDARVIHVRHNAVAVGGRIEINSPKTAAGLRQLPISWQLLVDLERHRRRVLAEHKTIRLDGPVLVAEDGENCINPSTLRRHLRMIAQRAGVEKITLHGLRHTCATLAIQRGVSVPTVQYILGHSTPYVTMGIYTHAQEVYTAKDWLSSDSQSTNAP